VAIRVQPRGAAGIAAGPLDGAVAGEVDAGAPAVEGVEEAVCLLPCPQEASIRVVDRAAAATVTGRIPPVM
jgi:hypothetical protein